MRLRLKITIDESVLQQLEVDNAQIQSSKFLLGIDDERTRNVADLQHMLLSSLTIKNATSGMYFMLGIDGYMFLPSQDLGIFHQNEELTLYATSMMYSRERSQQLLHVRKTNQVKTKTQEESKKRKYNQQALTAVQITQSSAQAGEEEAMPHNRSSSRYDGSDFSPTSKPNERSQSGVKQDKKQKSTSTKTTIPFSFSSVVSSSTTVPLDVYSHWKQLQTSTAGAEVESKIPVTAVTVKQVSSRSSGRKRGGRRSRKQTSGASIRKDSTATADEYRNAAKFASKSTRETSAEQITEYTHLEIGDIISFKLLVLCENSRSPIVSEDAIEGTITSLGTGGMDKRIEVCCESIPPSFTTIYKNSLPHNNTMAGNNGGTDNKLCLAWPWEELNFVQRFISCERSAIEIEKCDKAIVSFRAISTSGNPSQSFAEPTTPGIAATSTRGLLNDVCGSANVSEETTVNDDFGFMDAILEKRLEFAAKRMEELS